MRTIDFDYVLPEELIAQYPLAKRDTARLLLVRKDSDEFRDLIFSEIIDLINPQDLVVFNNTKVFPSRVFCVTKNGTIVETFFIRKMSDLRWCVLAKPARRLKIGDTLSVCNNPQVLLSVEATENDGTRILSLKDGIASIEQLLFQYGAVPLPPYIHRKAEESDTDSYQTIYAQHYGAVAAPTAGLHFSERLLQKLCAKGIDTAYVTLHVGIGTFRPVQVEDPRDHPMHEETYELSETTAQKIVTAKQSGRRIIAVGTTVVRVLEHCCTSQGTFVTGRSSTNLMILPGYTFKVIDGLITNFHLPRSTLLMLVSAFGCKEKVLKSYEHAIRKGYRFFSYGDAMIIL